MRRRGCILPDKNYKGKKTIFACLKTYGNYLSQSALYSINITSCSNSAFRGNLKLQKTKSDAPVMTNFLSLAKSIFLTSHCDNTS